MKQITTQQFIQASPETVWNILMDSKNYGEWNPFIVKMEGIPKKGGTITNTLMLGNSRQVFNPVILVLEDKKHFEWIGSLPLGIFSGRHYFKLTAENNGTLLEHGEYFTGWLSGLIFKKIAQQTREGFIAMNQALRERAEKA